MQKAKYSLVSGECVVDVSDMEEIRGLVTSYLQNNEIESIAANAHIVEGFVRELKEADAVVGEDSIARLDNWILEVDQDAKSLLIVRHAPRSSTNYHYFARIAKDRDGRWKVVGFGHRSVFGT